MLLEEQVGNLELISQAINIKIDEVYIQYCITIVAFLPSIYNKPESMVPNNLLEALTVRNYCLFINGIEPIGFG